jgi:hypothetical protein
VKKLPGAVLLKDKDFHTATHVIASDGTSPVLRTTKLLVGICCTPNIVYLNWLVDSARKGAPLPCRQYLITRDNESEKTYGVRWKDVLERSARNIENETPVLQGWSVFISPSLKKPSRPEFQMIVEAAGGAWLAKHPSNAGSPMSPGQAQVLVIVPDDDKSLLEQSGKKKKLPDYPKRRDPILVKPRKWLFDAIIRQRLEL